MTHEMKDPPSLGAAEGSQVRQSAKTYVSDDTTALGRNQPTNGHSVGSGKIGVANAAPPSSGSAEKANDVPCNNDEVTGTGDTTAQLPEPDTSIDMWSDPPHPWEACEAEHDAIVSNMDPPDPRDDPPPDDSKEAHPKSKSGAKSKELPGKKLDLPHIVPWHEYVDAASVLSDISQRLQEHVVMTKEQADALTLGVAATHCFYLFQVFPRFAIQAPEPECGKTTLLEAIEPLVPKPIMVANISTAAVFRTIEACKPTLLIDEADTFIGANDEMLGILNSGHRASGFVIRMVAAGDDWEPRKFPTFSPAFLARIGTFPPALQSRCIVFNLQRKRADQTVRPLRRQQIEALGTLGRKTARLIADQFYKIKHGDPVTPDFLSNRLADNWFPLFAVAEAVGADWPDRVLAAAKAIGLVKTEGQATGSRLLADIKSIFAERRTDRLRSAELVEALTQVEEAPWVDCEHGKPLTPRTLSRRLRPFEIKPKTIRISPKTDKGYMLDEFSDAFERYVPQEGGSGEP